MQTLTARTRATRRIVGAVAVVVAMSATTVVASGAIAGAQGGDLRQQAEELQNQIEAADIQISGLAEQLLEAETHRDAAQATAAEAQAGIQEAKAEVRRILDLVQQNLASLYRRTVRGETGAALDFSDARDLLKRTRYAEAQASRDDNLLERLEEAQSDLETQRDEAARARDIAAAQGQQIADAKAAIEAARGQQQTLLDSVQGELAAAVAAERAQREQAATAKVSVGIASPNVGPPNGSASQAIAYARSVIGAPYSTNPRTGPSYDCSGLTKSAWGAAGVSIGNTSGDQWNRNPHIPLEAVQPGDLIFWGPGGSSHVALYIGGGQIIDASSSQGQVTQRGIWGSPSGAARVV
jgi:cell wall-associated NlpC family hydrolase